ncbi:MAG: ParA family protein [Rhodanobacter sp.]|nr:MAG: ParA family protein [Rhodanobacter sp.]TAM14125.1 MAG: ParA family protein [Rhodanobacter sp.]TAM34948.1 MAG: ParA family protein [Rhodanobacter sp.]
MLVTLVASSKGGCGKSTVVTQLAAGFAQAGQHTAIVDADRQGSSFRWAERRPDNMPAVQAFEGARKALQRVPEDTAQLVIDTPAGSGERELEPFLELASVLLVPVLPSRFDLDATLRFLDELKAIRRIRSGKLPVGLVANRLKPWTNASQAAVDELAAAAPFPIVARLRDSQAYVLLTALGKGIFDYQSEQVRGHQQDWKPLLRWIRRQA